MAISQEESTTTVSAESLALAASVFTSQISSWIPANFGQSSSSSSSASQPRPISNADIVFQAEHERGERLGLGHPLLDVPRHQRRQDTSSSLSTLGKRLGLDAKGKGKGKGKADERAEEKGGGAGEEEDEEDEEEESRASIGKKRKVDKVDVWSGKKKAKSKANPAAPLSPKIAPRPDTTSEQPKNSAIERKDDTRSASDLTNHAPPTPSKPAAPVLDPALAGLNKNQRKKLRKKQKLLAQQAS